MEVDAIHCTSVGKPGQELLQIVYLRSSGLDDCNVVLSDREKQSVFLEIARNARLILGLDDILPRRTVGVYVNKGDVSSALVKNNLAAQTGVFLQYSS